MNHSKGFTLIEFLVTISIMIILMTLAVANFRSTQANARDSVRKTDVENIARELDSRYMTGFSFTDTTKNIKGSFPSTIVMNDSTLKSEVFRHLPSGNLYAPGRDEAGPNSVIVATARTADSLPPGYPQGLVTPSPKTSEYVYEPLKSDGTLCTVASDECRSFIISYRLEDNMVYTFKSRYR